MSKTIVTHRDFWTQWIKLIANDEQMTIERAMQHLHRHVTRHTPLLEDKKERWEEWLAGAYNLLAIVSTMKGCSPPHELGISLLLQKWLDKPLDHTPPPTAKSKHKMTVAKLRKVAADAGYVLVSKGSS